MNLHGIVSGAISAVNPRQVVTRRASQGSITNADGTITPQYGIPTPMYGQVQALSSSDLRQTDNLTMQSIAKTIYLSGHADVVERPMAKGGDLLTIGNNVWLVFKVVEEWPDWTHVIATLQDDAR